MRLTRIHVGAPLAPGARVVLPEAATAHLVRVLADADPAHVST